MERSAKRVLIPIIIIILSSCTTYPEPNLAIDFQGADVPVMLTVPENAGLEPEIVFSSGLTESSQLITFGLSSIPIYTFMNLNGPLNEQLLPVLMNKPAFIYISDIYYTEYYFESFTAGMMDEETMLYINATIERQTEQ